MIDDRNTQPDEDDPIGELNRPGRHRPKIGARAMALAGSTVGLGIAVVITASGDTSWTPTPWTR